MIDLTTRYLGLTLPHPFLAGASPLSDDLDGARRLEDAGAAAIVLRSLFEERVTREELDIVRVLESPGESFAEAASYLPLPSNLSMGPDDYLDHVQAVKEAVGCAVIASLNGTTAAGWLRFASLIEQAGADALELNVYDVVTDPSRSSDDVEIETLDMVREVKSLIRIPVAVKLSAFYTSLPNFARRLAERGAGALVLFNRLFQPEIDIDELVVHRAMQLSSSHELALRLRWLAILSAKLPQLPLAVTGGVHTRDDAIKALMCGATCVQLVSALMRRGPERLTELCEEVAAWADEHGYASLEELRGSMNHARCPDARAYERANYVELLQSMRR